jgi:hypothetical protein
MITNEFSIIKNHILIPYLSYQKDFTDRASYYQKYTRTQELNKNTGFVAHIHAFIPEPQ